LFGHDEDGGPVDHGLVVLKVRSTTQRRRTTWNVCRLVLLTISSVMPAVFFIQSRSGFPS
jgi:hypothetical protein